MAIYNGNSLTGTEIYQKSDVINFDYSGSYKSVTLPSGLYKFECWGARGGRESANGGYTSGNILVREDTFNTFYIYVGQYVGGNGASFNGCTAAAAPGAPGDAVYAGGGGGASDIRLASGAWNNTASLRSRIMVAPGGGGKSYYASRTGNGGVGGGLTGGNGQSTNAGDCSVAGGGTQTAGGARSRASARQARSDGGFGYGGLSNAEFGGNGGSGYYGGGGGCTGNNQSAGGGGGSAFISGHPGCNAINSSGAHTGQPNHYSGAIFANTFVIAGNASMPNPRGNNNITGNNGHGYVRITLICLYSPLFVFTSHKQNTKYDQTICTIPDERDANLIEVITRLDISVSADTINMANFGNEILSPFLNHYTNTSLLNSFNYINLSLNSGNITFPIVINLSNISQTDIEVRILRAIADYEYDFDNATYTTYYYIIRWKGNYFIGTDVWLFNPINILQPKYISFYADLKSMINIYNTIFYYSRDDGENFEHIINNSHVSADLTGLANADCVVCAFSLIDATYVIANTIAIKNNNKGIIKAY